MVEESTEAIKVAVQWLFAPLLVVAVLAVNRIENVEWRMENEGEHCWE